MDIWDIMKNRHSVRAYENKEIPQSLKETLCSCIHDCNVQSGLHMKLILDEPNAFRSRLAHYGQFSGVQNYILVAGKKSDTNIDEKCGYYGEKVVLLAQELGLNTCWVALTFNKNVVKSHLADDEKLVLVIAIGYGKENGSPHRSKKAAEVMKTDGEVPTWFLKGIEAALLAPTAINQQKFTFTLKEHQVLAKAGIAFYSKIDLGIVKYHFELGAGKENFQWIKQPKN